jgi:hypothetical protein
MKYLVKLITLSDEPILNLINTDYLLDFLEFFIALTGFGIPLSVLLACNQMKFTPKTKEDR